MRAPTSSLPLAKLRETLWISRSKTSPLCAGCSAEGLRLRRLSVPATRPTPISGRRFGVNSTAAVAFTTPLVAPSSALPGCAGGSSSSRSAPPVTNT